MWQVFGRASTSVAALAILGCTGDNPVQPALVRPEASAIPAVASAKGDPHRILADPRPVGASHDTIGLDRDRFLSDSATPVILTAAAADATPPAIANAAPSTSAAVGNRDGNRTLSDVAREQSLGFQNDAANEECLTEGQSVGLWRLRYSGFGCVGLTAGVGGTSLSMQPMVATSNEETHAPLMLGPLFGDRLMLSTRLETVQQLRKNGEPNAWEVAWLLWQYQDDEHFYYFIAKPNGWEVGKRDPSYPGGQRFLATGTEHTFPVGHAYDVQITHRGNVFSVVVDGVTLTTFADNERPYVSGRIALYSEDAEIKVHQVSVRSGAF